MERWVLETEFGKELGKRFSCSQTLACWWGLLGLLFWYLLMLYVGCKTREAVDVCVLCGPVCTFKGLADLGRLVWDVSGHI